MDEYLAKIDELRTRFELSYKEAADLLSETGGDLVAALIKMEARKKEQAEEMISEGPEVWSKIKKTVKDNTKKKIIISKEGRTVAKIPAPVGALGVLGALASTELAVLAGVGVVAALAKNYSFKIAEDEPTSEEFQCNNTDDDNAFHNE